MAALNKLSAQAVESAHAEDRSYKLFDGGGLFLLVTPKGRYWRLKYRWGGKEKLLALGTFPDVTLKKARKKRQNCATCSTTASTRWRGARPRRPRVRRARRSPTWRRNGCASR